MYFLCHNLDQNTNKKFLRIFALASKKKSNQKHRGTLYHSLEDFISTPFTLLFWFDLFLEARAKILDFFGRSKGTKRTFWNNLTFKDKTKIMGSWGCSLDRHSLKRFVNLLVKKRMFQKFSCRRPLLWVCRKACEDKFLCLFWKLWRDFRVHFVETHFKHGRFGRSWRKTY